MERLKIVTEPPIRDEFRKTRLVASLFFVKSQSWEVNANVTTQR